MHFKILAYSYFFIVIVSNSSVEVFVYWLLLQNYYVKSFYQK